MVAATRLFFVVLLFQAVSASVLTASTDRELSEATRTCLECHVEVSPSIAADWEKSTHFSGDDKHGRVGCAECHTVNTGQRPDTFDHNDFQVHTVVSAKDCATCHREPAHQYSQNLMAHAHGNLMDNPLYMQMVTDLNSTKTFGSQGLVSDKFDPVALEDSCLSCHGTVVEVAGTETRDTVHGELDFPVLSGWPNQGAGRVNPDGSLGSCTACHPRHGFSVETARKPYTCSQCHKGPDVPAYKVYSVSKHGNVFSSEGHKWDFSAKDWTVGQDFTAPTCATCHISKIVTPEGEVTARRTHAMSDRLRERLFGPLYVVPHPVSPQTSTLKNSAGLNLPSELADGSPVAQGLIDRATAKEREQRMKSVCLNCHAGGWVDGHFKRLDAAVIETNGMVRTSTAMLLRGWKAGLADRANVFDQSLERLWTESWLFYANSVRLSAAMGGADYGVFEGGRWQLNRTMSRMADMVIEAETRSEKVEKAKKP